MGPVAEQGRVVATDRKAIGQIFGRFNYLCIFLEVYLRAGLDISLGGTSSARALSADGFRAH